MKKVILSLFFTLFLANVFAQKSHNTLTKKEIRKGWTLLFDGISLSGWRNYNKQTIGEKWVIDDQAIKLESGQKEGFQNKGGGDIITDASYENYELTIDWKITKDGNSGIIFNVVEDPKIPYAWMTGPEMQVLDNDGHPDAKIDKHRAGDLYDIIGSSSEPVKAVGEWNTAKIINKKGLLQLFLNGQKVVETRIDDDNWLNLLKTSKFAKMPKFGRSQSGHICIQDHGDVVYYRNIKIRKLD